MKITIITATHNSGSTLRDTLESVLQQSYKDIEYIIVDGASKDNTLDLIKEYEPKFEGRLHWKSEKDKGIYDAMNKGISRATGDIVGILNSDDLYEDEFVISDIVQAFQNNRIDALFGNLRLVKSDDTNAVVRRWRGSTYTKGAFLKGWHPAHPTFYVRKEVYSKFGVFDTSFAVSADFELMLRFIEKERIATLFLDRYFVRMRVGGESTGSLSKIIQGNKNVIRAFKKNGLRPAPFYLFRRLYPKIIDVIKNKLSR